MRAGMTPPTKSNVPVVGGFQATVSWQMMLGVATARFVG